MKSQAEEAVALSVPNSVNVPRSGHSRSGNMSQDLYAMYRWRDLVCRQAYIRPPHRDLLVRCQPPSPDRLACYTQRLGPTSFTMLS